jgi:DNA-binding phage protein
MTTAPVGAVTIAQLLAYLREHRRQWPTARIAKEAKLPRSVVRRALAGDGNPTLRTLTAILGALGCDLMVAVTPGKNRLLDL